MSSTDIPPLNAKKMLSPYVKDDMPYRRRYGRYGRRSHYRRRMGARRNKKISLYTRRGAKSQARQIWRNQSQISGLQSKMKEAYTRQFYEMTGNATSLNLPGQVWPLIVPSNFARIFSTQPTSANGPGTPIHARLNNLKVRIQMGVELGTTVTSFDVYILQLHEKTAAVTRNNLGASLENLMQTDTAGTAAVWSNYYFTDFGNAHLEGPYGNMLNPDAFKIRAHRRFMMGDVPYSQADDDDNVYVHNIKDANKQIEFTIPHPIKLMNPLGANTSLTGLSWKSLTVDQIAPHKQLYLAIFSNGKEGTTTFVNWNSCISVNVPN